MSETFGGRTFDRIVRDDPRSSGFLVADLLDAPEPGLFARLRAALEGGDATAHPTAYDKAQDARLAKLEAAVFPTPAPPGPVPPGPVPVPPAPVPAAVPTVWPLGIVLDQGQEGECVGHGFAHWLASGPKPITIETATLQNPTAEHLYERAQQIDGSTPDEQSGASVLSGAKATKEHGGMASYHWAPDVGQIALGIQHVGPGVLGIPWRDSMMNPDANGVLDCSGNDVGGHCILVPSYYPKGSFSAVEAFYGVHNSWGASWGRGGGALIAESALASLIADQGECCFAVKS